MVSILRDITENMSTDEVLSKRKQQYDDLVSKIDVGIYVLHRVPEGAISLDYVSPKMLKILSVTEENLKTDYGVFFQRIHPDDFRSFVNSRQQVIRQLQSFDWEGRYLVDGSVKWLHFKSSPELLENGDVLWHGIVVDISKRKLAEERLFAMHMLQQREEERSAIARDLHDDLAQGLTAVHLELGFLSRTVESKELRERLTWAKEQVGDTIEMTRNILKELHSGVLKELGFVDALRYLADNLEVRTKISCFSSIELNGNEISDTIAMIAFRIVQEALNNVARHSNATASTLSVTVRKGKLTIVIEDDGQGIRKNAITSGVKFGISGMRERARLCGGTLKIISIRTGGTRVQAILPVGKSSEKDPV